MNQQIEEILDKLGQYKDPSEYESDAGREHLKENIRPIIETIERLFEAISCADQIPGGPHQGNVKQYLTKILNIIEQLAGKPDDHHFYRDWSQAQTNLNNNYQKLVNELEGRLSVAVAIGAPLGIEDVQRKVTELEDELATREAELETKTSEMIENVNQETEDILKQAREAAGHVALGEAQQEFLTLQKGYKRKAIFWGIVSLSGLALYSALIYLFIQQTPSFTGSLGESLYPTTLRIFSLGAGAAILAVLIRLLGRISSFTSIAITDSA